MPVAATVILEQLFLASDLAVVGHFSGAANTIAVAGIGANIPIIGLILNLFIGLALGVNVVIANAIGRKDRLTVTHTVHTAVVMAFIIGVAVALIGEVVAAPLLGSLNVPDDVLPSQCSFYGFISWDCRSSCCTILNRLSFAASAIRACL